MPKKSTKVESELERMIRRMRQEMAQGGGGYGTSLDPTKAEVGRAQEKMDTTSESLPSGPQEQALAAKTSNVYAEMGNALGAQQAMEEPGRKRMLAILNRPGESTMLGQFIDPIALKPKPEIINNPKNYWANYLTSLYKGTKLPNYLDFMPALPRAKTQSTDVQAGYEKAVTEFGGDPRLETRNAERDPAAFKERGAEFLEAAGKYAGEARGWEDPNTGQPIPISGVPRKDDPSMALWEQGLGSLSPEELENLKKLMSSYWRQ